MPKISAARAIKHERLQGQRDDDGQEFPGQDGRTRRGGGEQAGERALLILVEDGLGGRCAGEEHEEHHQARP